MKTYYRALPWRTMFSKSAPNQSAPNAPPHRRPTSWRALSSGWLLCCFCCVIPGIIEAATTAPQYPLTLQLEGDSRIELTDTAVIRKGKSEAGAETAFWTISARGPQLPLLFQERAGHAFLLYFTPTGQDYGKLHAIHIASGQTHWIHPVRVGNAIDRRKEKRCAQEQC